MSIFDLSGRTALVTGSSRGIGFALAKGLLQAGARVVIHGRDLDKATTSATTLADETGAQTRVSTFDVTDPADVERGIGALERDWDTPDILVNNAGVQRRRPFIEFRLEDWNDLVATNLTSAFLAVGESLGAWWLVAAARSSTSDRCRASWPGPASRHTAQPRAASSC